MSDMIYGTISVCICCLHVHANGECGCEQHDHEPLSKIEPPYTVTLGMIAEEHGEHCRREEDQECDCEQLGFSWSSCDGCGSPLGGDRHAMTLWGPPDS